ncbi:hypothetical protein IAD21_00456 [Abditibacteriota bacterium]|nr:hypothetical protein IAD21_00456 [Abditibacteriota bacterium]
MTSLELSRTVNDALQNGDFSAALAPLQSQPNLRVSDFPKLEKKSLLALSRALQTPANAEFWSKALVNTMPSVALFTFRTLTRLGESIRILGEPIQKALRDFWENQPPPREGVWDQTELEQRYAQETMLTRGFEMLLYANVECALELCCEQAKIYEPREIARQQLYKERDKRAELARRTVQEALHEHLPEALKEGKPHFHEMCQGVDYEVYKQVITRPDIAELLSPYGKFGLEPNHNPLTAMRNAFGARTRGKEEAMRFAREQAGACFRPYVDAGLQKDGEASAVIALAFIHYLNYFDSSRQIEDMSAVLRQSRLLVVNLPEEHPTRLLWVQVVYKFVYAVYGYTATINANCDPQEALNTLELLRLAPDATDTNAEFNKLVEKAKSAYRNALPKQNAVLEPEQILMPKPERVVVQGPEGAKHQTQSHSTRVQWGVTDSRHAFPDRTDEESARDFITRMFDQFQLLKEKIGVNEFKTQIDLDRAFRTSLQSINDERERHEVLLQLAQRADQGNALSILYYLRDAWAQGPDFYEKRKKFIIDVLDPLWDSFERVLPELAREEKKARGNSSSKPHSLFAIREQVDFLRRLLVEIEGGRAELRCVQTALRMGFRNLAEFWEDCLRRWLNGFPVVKPGCGRTYNKWTREDWIQCKLGEDTDDLLEHLAARSPQWSYRGMDNYEDGALPFYRRFTPESRTRCWQWVEQAINLDFRLVEMINGFDDEEMWLRVLAATPVTHPSFFEMWKRLRADTHSRDRVAVSVLESLANSTRDGGVAMMLQMLGEVELSELTPHTASLAQSLESPHPKVAMWAVKTLLKMPTVELDWPHVIDVVGEKLWSDNAALTKEAARFLGGVPAAHAALSWEKLEEALTLDNLALVDACLRSLTQLKRKDPAVTLGMTSTERLESLAQLAPERFAKLVTRLQTR